MAPAYEPVALRLRCQWEENAKRSAARRSLPELHHNSWVPWAEGDLAGLPVWLGAEAAHPRVRLRRRYSDALLAARGVSSLEIPAAGEGLLTRMLTSVLAGDTLSVYHALMRGVDPTPVSPLAAMKERLATSADPGAPQESA
jgi:glucose/mannose-6-phosphate isomerase